VDDDTAAILAQFDGDFAAEVNAVGLHSVSCLAPTNGIVLAMRQEFAVTDFSTFMYAHGGFAACMNSDSKPTPAQAGEYLVSLNIGSAFTWHARITNIQRQSGSSSDTAFSRSAAAIRSPR